MKAGLKKPLKKLLKNSNMVLDQIFTVKKIIEKPDNALYIGVIYTILSFIVSYLLFINVQHIIGIATILFVVILTTPLIVNLFRYGSKMHGQRKIKFLIKNRVVVDFFIYFFLGVFIAFFILALVFPGKIFSESQLYGEPAPIEKIIQADDLPPPPQILSVFSIFRNNMYVLLICFGLSLFFGAGAVFLIVLNASIFATALVGVIQRKLPGGIIPGYSFTICNLGIMFFSSSARISGLSIGSSGWRHIVSEFVKGEIFVKEIQ